MRRVFDGKLGEGDWEVGGLRGQEGGAEARLHRNLSFALVVRHQSEHRVTPTWY
jgi:hypothetical protein